MGASLVMTALSALVALAEPSASAAAAVAVVEGPGDQTAPSISTGQLAYADDARGAREIWVKDLTSGVATPYSAALVVQGGPVLDHGVLAFAIAGGVRVVAFDDPGASATVAAAGASGVSSSAQLVAWEQVGAGGRDVALLPVGAATPVVLPGDGDEHGPAVSYGWLAWLDDSGAGAIRLRDPGGAITTPFPARAREVALWGSSRLATPLLVAVVDAPAGGPELVVVDAAGAVRGRLARPVAPEHPRLGNEWVAFDDLSTGTSQVTLWQWTTGRLVIPSPTGQAQLLNDLRIEDQVMRLVWADARAGDLDIYLFESTLPLPDLPRGEARCDDPLAPVLADFLARRDPGRPIAGRAVFSLAASAPVLVCVDAQDVCAGWVRVGDHAVASPRDFGGGTCDGLGDGRRDHDHLDGDVHHDGRDDGDHDGDRDGDHDGGHDGGQDGDRDGDHDDDPDGDHDRPGKQAVPALPRARSVHLESRLTLPTGETRAWAVARGHRGATLRVRVLADGWQSPPRVACIAGVDCPDPLPPVSRWPGCTSGPGGLPGLLLALLAVLRTGRRRRT